MYDPEYNLLMERVIEECKETTEHVKSIFGEDHVFADAFALVDNALEVLERLNSEYDSCFEEEKQKHLKHLMDDVWEVIHDVLGALKKKVGK